MAWGRCNVLFLTIGLPVNVEKTSLQVKNIVVLEDLHRKITGVKRQWSTKQHVLISHSEIVPWLWRRRVRASYWIQETAGIGPKAQPVTPQGCRVTCWRSVCHLVGTQRGPEHREWHSERTSRWEKRNIPTSRPGQYNLFCPHSPVRLQCWEGCKNIAKLTKKDKNLGMRFLLSDLAVWVGSRWGLISWCSWDKWFLSVEAGNAGEKNI